MVELSIEDLSRQTYRFLSGNGTVGPNFNSQFVIVGYLLYTGIFNSVVYLEYSESKSPLYTSVSLSLSCIQGRHCHLLKFHIYVLVYCIGVFLSGLLHSV